MANKLGSLVVSLGLDAAEFVRGMTKSEYEAKKSTERLKATFAAFGAGLAGLGIGAAFTAAVSSAGEYAVQIERLSTLSAVSNVEFQKQAYAAKTVGVEMDKLSDIYKDVQDKVGDFMTTGGGEMKDFFEQIAPRVGVTADQFARLSGPEALQLYVSSLERAGVSQNEMVFYLEAIASDATLLLPLLQNNGKAMRDLGDDAQRLGKVLDEEAIRAGKEFDTSVKELTANMEALKLMVGNSVIPTINELTKEFKAGMTASGGFWSALNLGLNINPLKSMSENAAAAREQLAGLESDRERVMRAGGDVRGIDQAIASKNKELEYYKVLRRETQTFDKNDQSSAEERRLGLIRPTATYTPPAPKPAASSGPKAARAAADPAIKEAADREEEMQLLLRDRIGIMDEMDRKGKALYEATRTPLEQLTAKEAEYKAMLDKRSIDEETYWRARELAQDAYVASLDTVSAVVVEASKEAEEQARRMGDAYASTFSQALQGGMKFGDLLKKLAIDTISIQFLTPWAQSAGSSLANGIGDLFKSFAGGGYTGGGSRSGGLDGQGGYLAMLHPQETVIDHAQGQRMSLTSDSGGAVNISQVFNFGNSDASTVAALRAEAGRIKAETLAAVQAKANRGGSFARAVGRA